ncbi:MAG: hypothetical protein ACR2NA_14535 [Solirubrobacterales bacterium]
MAQKGSTSKSGSQSGADASWPEKGVQVVRDALQQGVAAPMNLVMLSRERIQEVMDDAVQRGRMTRDDANETVQRLVQRGRKQTDDFLENLEGLLNRTRDGVEERTTGARQAAADRTDSARKQAEATAGKATRQARDTAEPALREADKFRRAAGVGSFPITAYDELTAAQIKTRLTDLTPAQLREVREYEKKHGNRKTVLSAVESKLSE